MTQDKADELRRQARETDDPDEAYLLNARADEIEDGMPIVGSPEDKNLV